VLRRTTGQAAPRLVLCVGRLAAEKRVDVVIEGVARSRHRDRLRLVVAGAGPLERRLRQLAQRLGLPVEFGYVSQVRLARLHDEATVFIHASEVELEGMAVVEAMAAGLPVLIADAPASAAPRLAVDARFLFRPGDPDDLAAHLDALLDSPDALAFGGRRNLELAAALSFDDCVRRLESVYQRVLQHADERRRSGSSLKGAYAGRRGVPEP
jgi:glycosyltransferase involved in cell wall biosynthesis